MRRVIYRAPLIAMSALLLSVSAVGFGAKEASANDVDFVVSPASASGPVLRNHTITATPIYDSKEYEGAVFLFEVISGPNEGQSSEKGGCVPVDCVAGMAGDSVKPVSWTYGGGTRPGTDVIAVCLEEEVRGSEVIVIDGDDHDGLECVLVTKTWVDGGLPIGSNISSQAAENRARVAAAAQPAAVTAPRTGTGIVTPPNTGDAGLASSSSSSWTLFAIGGLAAFALAGLASLRFARR